MIFLEKVSNLEETNLNELGQKFTILQIFIIGDQLNKGLSQELPVFMGFGLCDNVRIVTKFAITGHFDQEIQSELEGLRFWIIVVELFKEVENSSTPQRIEFISD
jgi:hypothetical protein